MDSLFPQYSGVCWATFGQRALFFCCFPLPPIFNLKLISPVSHFGTTGKSGADNLISPIALDPAVVAPVAQRKPVPVFPGEQMNYFPLCVCERSRTTRGVMSSNFIGCALRNLCAHRGRIASVHRLQVTRPGREKSIAHKCPEHGFIDVFRCSVFARRPLKWK